MGAGPSALCCRVDLCACGDENFHAFDMAVEHGDVERGLAVAVAQVNVAAKLNQALDGLGVSCARSKMKRGPSAVGIHSRINVARSEQIKGDFGVSVEQGKVQRGHAVVAGSIDLSLVVDENLDKRKRAEVGRNVQRREMIAVLAVHIDKSASKKLSDTWRIAELDGNVQCPVAVRIHVVGNVGVRRKNLDTGRLAVLARQMQRSALLRIHNHHRGICNTGQELKRPRRARGRGHHRRSPAVVVHLVHRSLALSEHIACAHIVRARGMVQGRLAHAVRGIHRGSIVEKHTHARRTGRARCHVQQRLALDILGIDQGTRVEQMQQSLCIATLGSNVARGALALVDSVRLGSALDQGGHNLQMPNLGGFVQRGPLFCRE
eukprot:comp22425_c0_seq1/m.54890 comp22425_c0_seq1/g.54890  ORF comp22425_c0_seq1/g.54890 comp22425_c0_seq1/m.54890 type:complete len:377 (+) comp22425_c0_seq1:2209-3339(+)